VIDAPGWHLETAHDINDRGQICGNGTFAGRPAAFLLTPPLILPDLRRDRRWPIELPDGPPRPDEVMRRDGSILIRLNQVATSITDAALGERVRTALSDAGRPVEAHPTDRIRRREDAAAASQARPGREPVPIEE
jgi:hypothetical protein